MKVPKVSVRDLFWLVVVAAMAFAWWIDHRGMRLEVMRKNLENLRLALDGYHLRKFLESDGYVIHDDESPLRIERRPASDVAPD
jgi:hypothetical protein